ncbi:unnamed protein product [Prorocentrum cordatum]|uniref:Uncharacterized protein n=1 Tax=Prorocentrum cordatum TaxID=2364126 RepID=A0ABN9SU09_9DINO|nr:unnamed protein product [Polarella glacialis]
MRPHGLQRARGRALLAARPRTALATDGPGRARRQQYAGREMLPPARARTAGDEPAEEGRAGGLRGCAVRRKGTRRGEAGRRRRTPQERWAPGETPLLNAKPPKKSRGGGGPPTPRARERTSLRSLPACHGRAALGPTPCQQRSEAAGSGPRG